MVQASNSPTPGSSDPSPGCVEAAEQLEAAAHGQRRGSLTHRLADARSLDLVQIRGDQPLLRLAAAADDDEVELVGLGPVTEPQLPERPPRCRATRSGAG